MLTIHIDDRIRQLNQATEPLSMMSTKDGGYKQQFCNIDEVCKIPLMINDMFMAHHHFLEKTAYG